MSNQKTAMSELISRFESKKGRPPAYPWTADDARYLGHDGSEFWTDGKARRLHQGRDFSATLTSFRTMAHRKARDLGMIAHTGINKADSTVSLWFEPKPSTPGPHAS